MNILHVKYAVEVARAGSINKASETLLIAQPNLSRSIKELEADLGITIFDRSARGMVLTPDGEDFIHRAGAILAQIDEVESFYRGGHAVPKRFSVAYPASGYITAALTSFSSSIGEEAAEFCFREAGMAASVAAVASSEFKLGIIRYPAVEDHRVKSALEGKGLSYELVAESSLCVLASNKLAPGRSELGISDLESRIEVCCPSSVSPSGKPVSARRITVYGRAEAAELLSSDRGMYMWSSREPSFEIERYALAEYAVPVAGTEFRDVLIYRRDYRLSDYDRTFVTELCRSRRSYLQ